MTDYYVTVISGGSACVAAAAGVGHHLAADQPTELSSYALPPVLPVAVTRLGRAGVGLR